MKCDLVVRQVEVEDEDEAMKLVTTFCEELARRGNTWEAHEVHSIRYGDGPFAHLSDEELARRLAQLHPEVWAEPYRETFGREVPPAEDD
jgi:hypothetical protein